MYIYLILRCSRTFYDTDRSERYNLVLNALLTLFRDIVFDYGMALSFIYLFIYLFNDYIGIKNI